MTFAMHATDNPKHDAARRKAAEMVEIYSAPSIPVVEIAERNGVNVVFSDLGKFRETVAGFIDFGKRRIYVNKLDKPVRQRFTLAHELGHWVLHRNAFEANPSLYPVMPRFSSVDESNAFEQEANAFASELLVPNKLLDKVRSHPATLLADVFDVSRTMMEIRLRR